jgi:hypothetical protein
MHLLKNNNNNNGHFVSDVALLLVLFLSGLNQRFTTVSSGLIGALGVWID